MDAFATAGCNSWAKATYLRRDGGTPAHTNGTLHAAQAHRAQLDGSPTMLAFFRDLWPKDVAHIATGAASLRSVLRCVALDDTIGVVHGACSITTYKKSSNASLVLAMRLCIY
jgi:hypothetical protein